MNRRSFLMGSIVLMSVCALGLSEGEARAGETLGFNGYDFYPGDPHAHDGWESGDAESFTGTASLAHNDDAAAGDYTAIATTAWTDNDLSWFVFANHVNGAPDSSGTNGPAITDADGGDTYWIDTCADAYAMSDSTHLALCGAEVFFTKTTGVTKLGHKTLIFFTDTESDLSALTRDDLTVSGLNSDTSGTNSSDVTNCSYIQTWADGLETNYGHIALIPHHTAAGAPMDTYWNCHVTHERAMEIYSQHGNNDIRLSTESPPGSLYDKLYKSTAYDTNSIGTGTANYWLYNYYKNTAFPPSPMTPGSLNDDLMGIVAGTDGHRSRPGEVCLNADTELEKDWKYAGGITMAMIPDTDDFSREELYTSFVERMTYATSGPHIPVYFTVWNSGGTTQQGMMGGVLDYSANTTLKFKVNVPTSGAVVWEDDVAEAWVVKQTGSNAETTYAMTETATGEWTVNVSMNADSDAANDDVMYIRMRLSGEDAHPTGCIDDTGSPNPSANNDEYVWTSPVWTK